MTKKIRILIVEDNEDERFFIKEGFAASGLYEVVAEAGNGDELFRLLKQPQFPLPQMVLTDLNMPGKNGYDVIQEVRSDDKLSDIPVVVLTTAPYVPFAEKCKKLGACTYYSKPDTFLEYKSFAANIYQDIVTNCLKN